MSRPPILTNTPYNLRSRVVPQPIPVPMPEPKPVAEPIPEPVPEPEPAHAPPAERMHQLLYNMYRERNLIPQPSTSADSDLMVLPAITVCRLCLDGRLREATDPKITTPCCGALYHMSCLVFWNKENFPKSRCHGCRTLQRIGMHVSMSEPKRIDFVYKFWSADDVGLFVDL